MKTIPIKNYEGYYTIREDGLITSVERYNLSRNKYGEIKRKCGGKILKVHISQNGYALVELNKDGIAKSFSVHRLVYESFIGTFIQGHSIHHIDHNKTNNHFSNLILHDHKTHNQIHAHPAWNRGIKMKEDHILKAAIARSNFYFPKFKETFELKQKGLSNTEISSALGITTRTVMQRVKIYKEYINENTMSNI